MEESICGARSSRGAGEQRVGLPPTREGSGAGKDAGLASELKTGHWELRMLPEHLIQVREVHRKQTPGKHNHH